MGRGIRFLSCFCVGNRAGVHSCQRDRRSSQAEQQRSKRMATQAKFRDVLLVGLCAFVIVLPTPLIGVNSGAPGRFATVVSGGMVFSTTAALTVLPVLIVWITE